MFKKAERKKSKLRLALAGPSGSGKTTGALLLAKGLGGSIAVVDTERGSASLYADLVDFDVMELTPPYTPERYIHAIQEAEKAGYSTLILDSITHEWAGAGGILAQVDIIAKARYGGNSIAAWAELTPRHQAFIDTILASKMHVIVTMRTKAVYLEVDKGGGKKKMEKHGSTPQQRDGLEYDFTTMLDLSIDGHFATTSKDRTGLFKDPVCLSEKVGKDLITWLEKGKDVIEQDPLLRQDLFAYFKTLPYSTPQACLADLSTFFERKVTSTTELTNNEIVKYLTERRAQNA